MAVEKKISSLSVIGLGLIIGIRFDVLKSVGIGDDAENEDALNKQKIKTSLLKFCGERVKASDQPWV